MTQPHHRPFLQLAAVLMFLSYADYGFQFLNQMALGRLLSVEDYGIYGALNGLGTLFTLFGVSFPLLALRNISRVAGEQPDQARPCLHETLRVLSIPLLVFGGLIYALAPLLKDFFHLQSVGPLWLMTTVCILACYQSTLIAALQALQFYAYTSALAFGFTLMRFCFGVMLIYFFHTGYYGAFYGLLIAVVVSDVWMYALLRRKARPPARAVAQRFHFTGWENAILISVGMATLIGIDTSLARHYLNPSEAGLYSAASSIAKIVLLVGGPFLALVVPEVTRAQTKAGATYPFGKLMLMSMAISLAAWVLVSLVPDWILLLMLGRKFVAAAGLVPPLAAGSLCLTNVALMNQYCFALGLRRYFYAMYGAALAGIGGVILFFHQSAAQLAYGIMAAAMLALVLGFVTLMLSPGRRLSAP